MRPIAHSSTRMSQISAVLTRDEIARGRKEMYYHTPRELESLVNACERDLGDDALWFSPDGYPASLALCIIDAVFSIGVKYVGVVNLVRRYRAYRVGQTGNADADGGLELMGTFEHLDGPEGWAAKLENKQRTSTKSGILKSEAVLREAHILARHGIWTVRDLLAARQAGRLSDIKADWCAVPGQRSAISWSYFLMLARVLPEDDVPRASTDKRPQLGRTSDFDDAVAGVKPDRMIKRYVANAIGVGGAGLSDRKAAALVKAAAGAKGWDVIALDHAIWRFESGRPHELKREDW
ncbi:heme peroxidase [Mycolicibacterium sp. 120270]|uniref:heme peroxidase n=1 Tax=Mycolicibacterium sp. 120270 TaxID=3090600 RepID=UPI00299EF525|nr:heme peroxidase [Mycolicibacterium sp. 120270]MDX1885370.1 heme peroxidase [Mycolicibacterium sp. 120270]